MKKIELKCNNPPQFHTSSRHIHSLLNKTKASSQCVCEKSKMRAHNGAQSSKTSCVCVCFCCCFEHRVNFERECVRVCVVVNVEMIGLRDCRAYRFATIFHGAIDVTDYWLAAHTQMASTWLCASDVRVHVEHVPSGNRNAKKNILRFSQNK